MPPPVQRGLSAVSRRPGFITVGIHRPGVFVTPTLEISTTEARAFVKHLVRIVDAMQVADENLDELAAAQPGGKVIDLEAEKNGSGI